LPIKIPGCLNEGPKIGQFADERKRSAARSAGESSGMPRQ
jgi:hypothetical protein